MGASASVPQVNYAGTGLLQCSTAEHFASIIADLPKAGALLTSRGLLWAALCEDASSNGVAPSELARLVEESALAFFDSGSAEAFRKGTLRSLLSLMSRKGQFILFVGGKNVGKSYMLQAAAAKLNGGRYRVVVVNGRAKRSLAEGIAEFLVAVASEPFAVAVARRLGGAAAAADVVSGSGGVLSVLLSALAATAPIADVVDAYIVGTEAEDKHPIIVVDEVNRLLVAAGDEDIKRDTIALLPLDTIELRRLTVVLAASDYSEQCRLEEAGFRTEQLTAVVVASEVAPAEMLTLLSERWKCGPRLAAALVSVYGGHLWLTYQALVRLATSEEAFEAIAPFSASQLVDGAAACLTSGRPTQRRHMARMLRGLAEDGFVPLASRTDECAAIVTANGVGGIVSRSALADGVPPQAWSCGSHAFVLVPSSQAMRLVLCRSDEVQQAAPLWYPGHTAAATPAAFSRPWWDLATTVSTAPVEGSTGAGTASAGISTTPFSTRVERAGAPPHVPGTVARAASGPASAASSPSSVGRAVPGMTSRLPATAESASTSDDTGE